MLTAAIAPGAIVMNIGTEASAKIGESASGRNDAREPPLESLDHDIKLASGAVLRRASA